MGKKSKKKRQQHRDEGTNEVVSQAVLSSDVGNLSGTDEFSAIADQLRDALADVFGQDLMASNRDAINRIMLDSLIPGGGWAPRNKFDPKMITDFHAWCVDEKGMVHDYPDDQLIKGNHAMKHVVRRPWDVTVVVEALPHIEKLTQEQFFDKNRHLSSTQLLKMLENNTFPINHCYARAKILRDSSPNRFALVLGSLGYRQSGGNVFWECG